MTCRTRTDRIEGSLHRGHNGQVAARFFNVPKNGTIVGLEHDIDTAGADRVYLYVECPDENGPLRCGKDDCPECSRQDVWREAVVSWGRGVLG